MIVNITQKEVDDDKGNDQSGIRIKKRKKKKQKREDDFERRSNLEV